MTGVVATRTNRDGTPCAHWKRAPKCHVKDKNGLTPVADKVHRNSLKPGYKLHWYRIERVLGQGGFGITYLASDFNLDREVAIKEYLPIEFAVREGDASIQPVSDDKAPKYEWGLRRFIDEARTLAKFKHPNIVRVLNVFEANNSGYMVMEFENGQTLQDHLARGRTFDESELLNILTPILGGLEQVHARGFIHRDIKPANLFLRDDGSPVLIDFGSARQALGVETRTLTSVVSSGYSPFEQYVAKSDQQGPWTDIYALGATLYRVVCGRSPLDANDRGQGLLHTQRDTLVGALEIARGRYSERFLHAIDHALQFRPDERPQTIAEWREDFAFDPISGFPRQTPAPDPPRARVISPAVQQDAETVAASAAKPSTAKPPKKAARADAKEQRIETAAPSPAPTKTRTRREKLLAIILLVLVLGLAYGMVFSNSAHILPGYPPAVSVPKPAIDDSGHSALFAAVERAVGRGDNLAAVAQIARLRAAGADAAQVTGLRDRVRDSITTLSNAAAAEAQKAVADGDTDRARAALAQARDYKAQADAMYLRLLL
jgi:serine/threonine protein kinase